MTFFWYYFLSLVFFCADVFVRSDDPSSPTCLTGEEAKEFNKRLVKIHNVYRARHDTPPLKANDELMEASIEWSKGLVAKGEMEHSKAENKYGENLYQAQRSDNAIDESKLDPVKPWYKEIKLYKPGQNFNEETGHFTQVVWKSSENVGCGVCNGSTGIFVTCRYTPPGNVVGEFGENVLPLKSGPHGNKPGTKHTNPKSITPNPDEPGTTKIPDDDDGDFNITEILLFLTTLILLIFVLIAMIGMVGYGIYAIVTYFKTNNPDHDV